MFEPSTDVVRLVLVRHGQTAANLEMRYVGRRDDPLSDEGARQARCLPARLEGLPIAALLSSPLLRARETADPVARALDLEPVVEPRLAEYSFGAWEGLTREEVLALGEEAGDHHRRWLADPAVAPPGGESSRDVQGRMTELAGELAGSHGGRWVALVSHVGPIKALVAAALGVPLAVTRRMFLGSATVTVLDWGPRPLLWLFNAHDHLGWGSARWVSGG